MLGGGGWPGSLQGQDLRFAGRIVHAETGEAIPYASIRLADRPQGVLSNAEGAFVFSLPLEWLETVSYLEISSIGFATRRIPLEEAPSATDESWEIALTPQVFTLSEVIIYSSDLGPQDMAALAFRNRKTNYADAPYLAHAFYRHYCREGGRYGRLIEAAVDLYDGKGHRRFFSRPAKKVGLALRQLRRSVDFTALAGRRHLPIALYPTLEKDYISYENPLAKHTDSDYFDWSYADTTYYKGSVLYVVRATGQIDRKQYIADLFIEADTWAIVRIEEHLSRAYRTAKESYRRSDHFVASYSPYQGRYYLDYLLNEGEFVRQQYDSLGQVSWQDDHFHHVEWMVNGIELNPSEVLTGKEPSATELDLMPYAPAFWEQYAVLQATPLEEQISRDLAANVALQQQFEEGESIQAQPELQDALDLQQFAQLQDKYSGNLMVLCFWDGSYQPGVQTLLRGRKLFKAYAARPPGLVFLSLDTNEAAWLAAIRKRKLYLGSHMRLRRGGRSPIARRFGVSASPTFILLGPDGAELMRTADLPKVKEIEAVLENR